MPGRKDGSGISRRRLLRASGAAVGAPAVGTARGRDANGAQFLSRCPEATAGPNSVACEGATAAACADDHPETRAIQAAVRETLEESYPTVGALMDDGYVPYFDVKSSGEDGGWSHWLNPRFVGDDAILDPRRPEAVLVDNEWWRPIGAMFVATRGGDAVERPPAVYKESEGDGDSAAENDSATDGDGSASEAVCSPWHSHVGLPGRFAWWYYRQAYEDAYRDGEILLPCRTPCVLHVWIYPNPGGVYAHDAPPREQRGGPPAEPAGFETAADPDEDDLAWGVLPDEVVPDRKPSDFSPVFGLG